MDPASVALLIEAIIAIVTAADNAVANGLATDRNTKLSKSGAILAKEIATDESLANKLLSAYQQKDSDLFQNLINSSPFGSRFRQLKQEYIKNKADIAKVQDEINRIQTEGQAAQSDLNSRLAQSQTSGEVITDLILGRAKVDTNKPEYNRTDLGGNYAG